MGCGISSHRQIAEGAGRVPEPQRHGPPAHRTGQHAVPNQPQRPRSRHSDSRPDAGVRATNTGAIPSSRPPPLALREGSPVPAFPDQPTPSKKRVEISMADPVSCFFRGNELMEAGHYPEAIEAFSQVLRKRQDFARAYHGRGLAHLKNDEPAASIEDFTQAIRLQPGDEAYLCDRAAAYNANGEWEMAIKDCNAALAINPASSEAFNARGVAHKHLGNVDKAVEDWEEAAQLEPRNICVICMENKRGVRTHPCNHSVMCPACAKEIEQKKMPCPVCSTPITKLEFGQFGTTFSSEELTKALHALPPLSPLGATPLGMSPLGQGHTHRSNEDGGEDEGARVGDDDPAVGGDESEDEDDDASGDEAGHAWREEGDDDSGQVGARAGQGDDGNEGGGGGGAGRVGHPQDACVAGAMQEPVNGPVRRGLSGRRAASSEGNRAPQDSGQDSASSRNDSNGGGSSHRGASPVDASLSFAALPRSCGTASARSSEDGSRAGDPSVSISLQSGFPSASISFAMPRGGSPGGGDADASATDAALASLSLAPPTQDEGGDDSAGAGLSSGDQGGGDPNSEHADEHTGEHEAGHPSGAAEGGHSSRALGLQWGHAHADEPSTDEGEDEGDSGKGRPTQQAGDPDGRSPRLDDDFALDGGACREGEGSDREPEEATSPVAAFGSPPRVLGSPRADPGTPREEDGVAGDCGPVPAMTLCASFGEEGGQEASFKGQLRGRSPETASRGRGGEEVDGEGTEDGREGKREEDDADEASRRASGGGGEEAGDAGDAAEHGQEGDGDEPGAGAEAAAPEEDGGAGEEAPVEEDAGALGGTDAGADDVPEGAQESSGGDHLADVIAGGEGREDVSAEVEGGPEAEAGGEPEPETEAEPAQEAGAEERKEAEVVTDPPEPVEEG